MKTTSRDYFAEMYVAGVLADAGWDVYFPRRDRGFDMIVSCHVDEGTLVRPVQVKGKYATEKKTDKNVYGYVGALTALHPDMVLAIPFFGSKKSVAPLHIAWMTRSEIRPSSRGYKCQPARFEAGRPEPRPGFRQCFDEIGLSRLTTAST